MYAGVQLHVALIHLCVFPSTTCHTYSTLVAAFLPCCLPALYSYLFITNNQTIKQKQSSGVQAGTGSR